MSRLSHGVEDKVTRSVPPWLVTMAHMSCSNPGYVVYGVTHRHSPVDGVVDIIVHICGSKV